MEFNTQCGIEIWFCPCHGDPVYRSVRERQTKPNVYTYIFFIFAQHFNIVPWRYNENNYVINALYLIVTYGVWHSSKTRTSGIFCVINACVNIFSLNDGQILRKHKVHNTVITWCNCITNMATLLCLWIYEEVFGVVVSRLTHDHLGT